jgi:DnaJ-class molecular chaperone
MPARDRDPYEVLGIGADASDAELRAAYRRLVQLHHPDHNGGSAEAARRFEEVQDAYAQIKQLRMGGPAGTGPRRAGASSGGAGASAGKPGASSGRAGASAGAARGSAGTAGASGAAARSRTAADPDLDARLAEMERDLREAHLARERARQAAREAAAKTFRRPSDEELGYVKTDDSFSKILADARDELSDRFAEASEHPAAKRVGDLIDELAAKLTGESPPRSRR